MARGLAIVNPAAGRGTAREEVEAVLDLLRERFETIDVVETGLEHPTATELGERAVAERYDVAIAAGGDGTVGGVARALVGSDVTLGILPFGTFMNIARALEIPRDDPRAAAELIARSTMRKIDVGEVGGQVFFEAAGIGLDAEAFSAGHAIQRGQHGYALAALRALLRRRSARVKIEIDGRARWQRVLQAVVSNGPWYGWGFEVAPGAHVDDGKLDVVIFGDGKLRVLRELIAAAIDRDRPARGRRHRGKRITFSATRDLAVHADGIVVGRLPQTFVCRPGALRVYAPRAN
ncbi:MAG TPA: diacylglycerol kinase family protein [Candidatus Limnocylindria bacterium]|nr:diacylglycerol kinase family protein [Candidatus Limnocylindria bacterium]